MLVDTDIQPSAAVTARPGVEVYHVANEDDVEMALLNNLETPLKLAFVGGDAARTFAKEYGGVWIADGPDAEGDLLRWWDLQAKLLIASRREPGNVAPGFSGASGGAHTKQRRLEQQMAEVVLVLQVTSLDAEGPAPQGLQQLPRFAGVPISVLQRSWQRPYAIS